jgi:glucosamine-6-phosphate deaminase
VCYAGVGITGHLAFNEPPEPGEQVDPDEFLRSVTRVVLLSRETVTINSNTALRGAMNLVPQQAVTIGFKRIMAARKLRIYLNRPWQSAVVRRFLFGPETVTFPVSLARQHPDVAAIITSEVAAPIDLGLR